MYSKNNIQKKFGPASVYTYYHKTKMSLQAEKLFERVENAVQKHPEQVGWIIQYTGFEDLIILEEFRTIIAEKFHEKNLRVWCTDPVGKENNMFFERF